MPQARLETATAIAIGTIISDLGGTIQFHSE